jgi:hypothetical protein
MADVAISGGRSVSIPQTQIRELKLKKVEKSLFKLNIFIYSLVGIFAFFDVDLLLNSGRIAYPVINEYIPAIISKLPF